MSGAPLTAEQRAELAAAADVLIPGGEGMPSASEVGVEGTLVDRVLAQRPHAARDLPAALDALAALDGPIDDRVRRLRAGDGGAFGTISSVVVGAYFLDERPRVAIGYPGQGPKEATFEDETGYLAEGLLDPVLDRGGTAPGT